MPDGLMGIFLLWFDEDERVVGLVIVERCVYVNWR